MKTALASLALIGSLSACANSAQNSLVGFIGEEAQNPNITYWETGTPLQSDKVLATMGIVCDRIQPIFDKTTGKPIGILPESITQYGNNSGVETVIVCVDEGMGDI